jgi:N-acetylglucosamine-6-phosphate deacetylase
MGGQYFDPLTVECPFCKTKAAYPLKDLENYQAICIQCKKSLAQVSRQMDQTKQKNSSELSNFWLKLELFDDYIMDESLTDEEFDNLQTLGELIDLLKRFDPDASIESVAQHPKLSSAIKILSNQPIDKIKLDDLAVLQTRTKKFPFEQFALVGARIFTGDEFLNNHAVIINGESIESIVPTQDLSNDIQQIPLNEGLLAPGFIDLQVNGGGGKFFTHEHSLSTIETMLNAHRSKGTTSLLPTLISESASTHQQAANSVLTAINAGFKGVLGLHIEGPFFAKTKRGAHAEKFIRSMESTDIDWLKNLAAAQLKILITLAPETLRPNLIHDLTQQGILVFAGHTDATYEQIQTANNEGLAGFTHLYNAMSQMTAREPGVVGAALENSQTWCGIILDGHHVHPAAARLAYQLKNEKLFLVSDAMATVGGDKSFTLYDETISEISSETSPKLVNQNGKLAGSAIGLIDAVKYAHKVLQIDLAESLRMASLYPARCIKLDNQLGRIQSGYRADLVHFTDDFQVKSTWVAGEWKIHN